MKKIGIIGHFGKGHHLHNGQTVKTQVVYDTLTQIFNEKEIMTIDTRGGLKFLVKMPFVIFYTLATCKNIIIMPAYKAVFLVTPVVVGFNLLFHRSIHYITIGGRLPKLLTNHKWLVMLLRQLTCIYPETKGINEQLEKLGLTNTQIMPNFKSLPNIQYTQYTKGKPYRLCTFSRVSKEKGIAEAICAVNETNKQLGETAFALDIYGEIDNEQWFKELMLNQPKNISYKGTIKQEESCIILKKYFALLFPTYYKGECFAGTIIDAFTAGIPVFASDWHDNKNIIKDNITGRIYKAKSVQSIIDILLCAYEKPIIINEMRKKCIIESQKYKPENIIQILTKRLIIK